MKSSIVTDRARRCLLGAALTLGLLEACAVDDPTGAVLGSGGVGVIQYSTTDTTTPSYWGPDPNSMSGYFGGGGDSVQPDLQPRPALHADRLALLGDEIASLAIDWPSRSAEVRVAPLASPNDASSVADLTRYAHAGELDGDGGAFFIRFDGSSLFVHGSDIIVVIPAGPETEVLLYEARGQGLELAASTELPFGIEGVNLSVSERASPPMGWPRAALIGDALVFQARDHGSVTFEVVDLGTPGHLRHVASVNRGKTLEAGPLRGLAGMAVSERRVETPGRDGAFSFVLDRLDVSDPNRPVFRRSLNVPGAVIGASADATRLITVGFERAVLKGVTTCCPGAGGCGGMVDTCEVTRERVSLVEVTDDDAANTIDTLLPETPLGLNAVASGALGAFGSVGGLQDWPGSGNAEFAFVSGLESRQLEITRQPVDDVTGGYQSPFMAANGAYVAIPTSYSEGFAVAPVTPEGVFGTPSVTPVTPTSGELFGPRVSDFLMTDDTLFVATGSHGIVAVPLEP